MSNFDINVDRRMDRKADAYIAPCYKQVRQKELSEDQIIAPLQCYQRRNTHNVEIFSIHAYQIISL